MDKDSQKIRDLELQIKSLQQEITVLQQCDDRWQALLDTSPEAIFIADVESGLIVEANKYAEELLGYTHDELIGLHQTQLHPPSLREKYAKSFRKSVVDGRRSAMDMYVQRKDGEVIPVEIFDCNFYRNQKQMIFGFFRDLSKIVGSQQSLAASVERYKFLFNKANDGLTVYHPLPDGAPGNFIEVNEAACRIFRLSRDELLKLSPKDMVIEHEWTATISHVIDDLKNKGSAVFVIQVRRNDNRIITVEIHDHLFEFDGQPTVLSIIRDITERIEAEEKFKHTQEKLIYTDKMVALGQLVAGVAHELNNTVNFITGAIPPLKRNINQLQEGLRELGGRNCTFEKGDSQQKDVENIDNLLSRIEMLFGNVEEGARRTSNIVHDLKVFAHKKGEELVCFDIHEILESNLALLYHEYKERIDINSDFCASIHKIYCHPDLLSQVFMNLFLNAIQAIPEQGEIWLRTWNANEKLYVSVRDTGTGVSEEIKSRIFEPFFTTKEVGDGTGLGLSISYSLVKKHKGEITLDNNPEQQGSEFVVSLPVDLCGLI